MVESWVGVWLPDMVTTSIWLVWSRESSTPQLCGWLTELSQRASSALSLPHPETVIKKLKSCLCVVNIYRVFTLCRALWEGRSVSLLSRNLAQLERHICVSLIQLRDYMKLAKLKVASKEVKQDGHGLWIPFCLPTWLNGLGQVT